MNEDKNEKFREGAGAAIHSSDSTHYDFFHHMKLKGQRRKKFQGKRLTKLEGLATYPLERVKSGRTGWKLYLSLFTLVLFCCACLIVFYDTTVGLVSAIVVCLLGIICSYWSLGKISNIKDISMLCDDHSTGAEDLIKVKDVIASSYASLGTIVPGFRVSGDDIVILDNPESFYMKLREYVGVSKCQITLVSLYIGNGELERELLNDIEKALEVNRDLKVKILIDGLRGTRGDSEQSSCGMLLPLLNRFIDRISLSLYHSPDLSGFKKRLLPARYNELIGVAHMKFYIFDNSLIVSGANLSHTYFTDRQDRYILIKNSPTIVDYFTRLTDLVCSFSYKVIPSSDNQHFSEFMTHDPVRHSKQFKKQTKKSIQQFIEYELRLSQSSIGNDPENSFTEWDTIIYPLIQMAPFDVRQDELVTSLIMSKSNKDSLFYLTSGYFNFTESFMDLVVYSAPKYTIFTASPEANGFFNSHGLSSYVPQAYVYLAKAFLHEVKLAHQERINRIEVLEYSRPGWTYHAKGLWLYLPNQSLPSVTLIGSPNFGYRSLERDLEAQIMLVTRNETLRRQLHQELDHISKYCVPLNESLIDREDRRTSFLMRLAMLFARSFL